MATQRFPVEAAHVMMFARSVGDPNPVYVDPEQAGGPCLAPPTFGIAADHFDPDYERRPRPGVPWFGSGARPISVEGGSQQPTGGGSGFHAQEHFTYHRALRVGDVLFGSVRAGASWHKQGRRGGKLSFREHLTDYCDADGTPVLTLSWVDVLTERVVDGGDAGSGEATAAASPAVAADGEALDTAPDPVRRRGGKLLPGAVHEQVLVEDLKRTQIVMYAGASGDFHPMHSDEAYAQAMGMPGTFAHGMLTMGITARALTDLAGDGVLADYGARFAAQVWPGDTLTARVTLAGVVLRAGSRLARLDVTTTNQKGETILTGRAHARI
jgi:acyl dehydratase